MRRPLRQLVYESGDSRLLVEERLELCGEADGKATYR
jgi:hypothetical protein